MIRLIEETSDGRKRWAMKGFFEFTGLPRKLPKGKKFEILDSVTDNDGKGRVMVYHECYACREPIWYSLIIFVPVECNECRLSRVK